MNELRITIDPSLTVFWPLRNNKVVELLALFEVTKVEKNTVIRTDIIKLDNKSTQQHLLV